MQTNNLGLIEKKVLGALIVIMDENNIAKATLKDIASIMGYKDSGGAMSFALKVLERDNFLVRQDQSLYKILI